MRPKKSAAKSAIRTVPGRPFVSADPRAGRGPAKGAPNAGRPPDEFRAMMRDLASRAETVERLTRILTGGVEVEIDGKPVVMPVDSDTFLKALAFVTDRGYGKAQQHLDVTSDGQSLTRDQIAGMSVTQLRAEIAARMARA
jgi:hypothetical protein